MYAKYWGVLLLICSGQLLAQLVQPYFQAYTSADGLGGEAINDILVDRYGYVWTAAYSGLHRYDGYNFVNYAANPLDSCALSNRTVLCLLEDPTGYLWVGTRAGLNRLDRSTGCFHRYFHDPTLEGSIPGNEVTHLALDASGSLVVQTNSGTARYRSANDDFASLPATGQPWERLILHGEQLLAVGPAGLADPDRPRETLVPIAGDPPNAIFTLLPRGDSLLIGTSNGLFVWQKSDSLIYRSNTSNQRIRQDPIMDMLPARVHGFNGYWVATRGSGLAFIDLDSGEGWAYEAGNSKGFSLLDDHVRALAYDSLGSLWIGSYVGLNRFQLSGGRPVYYRNSGSDNFGDQVLEIFADSSGSVYLYERWRGLYRSERLGREMKKVSFPQNDFLEGKDLNFITADRNGTTWFLRGNDGLYRYDPILEKPVLALRDSSLTARRLNGMAQDVQHNNIYWLATEQGLGRLDLDRRIIRWWLPADDHPILTGNALASLFPSADGRIWLSAGNYYSDRLGYFEPATETFRFYPYQPGNPDLIAGGRIKQIAGDRAGNIWCAASQGLLTVDAKTDTPRLITRIGKRAIGALEAILTDTIGGVWFTRNDQIGHYRPATGQLEFTTCSPIRQFANAVATIHPDGHFLFGGMGGIAGVKPYAYAANAPRFPRIVINQVSVNGRPHTTERPVQELRRLELSRKQRNFSLRFAGLLFDRTRYLEYAYRIDDGPWLDLGTERSLSFAGLQPGAFQLALRSTDGEGNWNPEVRELTVVVAPFWYETGVARLLLLLLLLLLAFYGVRFFLRRRLERQSLAQMQQLAAFKSRFLTNLTHEFRTPLTLILGPAKRLGQRTTNPTVAREGRRIQRQGKRLLGLINQLLDLRKLEEGKFLVTREVIRLQPFLASLTETFRAAAADKSIDLQYNCEDQLTGAAAGAVEVDKSKVETIVTNLLANAVKFTPVNGNVKVRLTENTSNWTLEVTDSGPGISPEHREQIFDRFVRVSAEAGTGTGIGLALARELARLLDGDIRVGESTLGGAAFVLRLPRHVTDQLPEAPTPSDGVSVPAANQELPKRAASAAATVLVVEDDPDLRAYLTESLAESYSVISAPDGEEGLETALREIPDLVVSDVMMPGLNGLQLCARLKNDRRTSHLPVLLLTARSADEHRLAGLEHGADAYLSKPFSERELHLRLRNLLTLRDAAARELRSRLLRVTDESPSPGPSAESDFIEDLRQLITDRLDDPDLAVSDLEKGLGLSRSQLHRKLKANLGLSAGKVITQLRLETAAERLRTGNDPISQIAYDCGFRDGSYFGKRFRARYGVSPGVYREG